MILVFCVAWFAAFKPYIFWVKCYLLFLGNRNPIRGVQFLPFHFGHRTRGSLQYKARHSASRKIFGPLLHYQGRCSCSCQCNQIPTKKQSKVKDCLKQRAGRKISIYYSLFRLQDGRESARRHPKSALSPRWGNLVSHSSYRQDSVSFCFS